MWHHREHLTIKCDTTETFNSVTPQSTFNNKMWHHRVQLTVNCDTTEYI